ncbi:heptosyltransferase-1 [Rhodoferax ferrireducens]|uniref:Lipopolysaccharide heptosyltransferase 1 n=1 Tax=Rhodoferax ferrireducens TaxID=192843 RepID=A0ABU2C6H7_9BURK|nr:lipopolysaccharide heptosyltransferase I [Rhodoferax ferrireducens]MDR7376945.1 heptosyltransferase-1 [Rhodoferax ferrireducens]
MRILIVKISSLGDVIQTLPALHDMRQALPQATFDWVVEEAFAPLLKAHVPGLARVIPVAQRRWRKTPLTAAVRAEKAVFLQTLQAEAYDVVLDFQGLIKSVLIARQARLAPGGWRSSYGNRSEDAAYEWPVRWLVQRPQPMPPRIHSMQRYRRLAALALGYAPRDDGIGYDELQVTPVEPDGSVMLVHGTTRVENEWPLQHWIQVGQALVAQGLPVSVPQANPAEAVFAQQLCEAIGPQAQVLPRMGLAALAARMAGCVGVIGVDSGLSHLAVALNLPHVQIFSQPRIWRAGPVGCSYQVAVGGEQAPDVDTVLQAWQAVWADFHQKALLPASA